MSKREMANVSNERIEELLGSGWDEITGEFNEKSVCQIEHDLNKMFPGESGNLELARAIYIELAWRTRKSGGME